MFHFLYDAQEVVKVSGNRFPRCERLLSSQLILAQGKYSILRW